MIKKYKIRSIFSPFLFRGPTTGQLYIMPGWIECPEGTTIDEVDYKNPYKKELKFIKKVKASKGDIYYTITKKGDEYKCTCPGALYHTKICKHIKALDV